MFNTPQPQKEPTQYAIAFSFDQELLSKTSPTQSYAEACLALKEILAAHGFTHQLGFMYMGVTPKVNAVVAVLAVQDFAKKHAWFATSLKYIKLLRIEETTDLMPSFKKMALNKAVDLKKASEMQAPPTKNSQIMAI